jgi:hypothetical protein
VGGEERPGSSGRRGGPHRNGRSAAEDRATHVVFLCEHWRRAVAARRFGAIRERRPPRLLGAPKKAAGRSGRLRNTDVPVDPISTHGRRGLVVALSSHGEAPAHRLLPPLAAPGIEAEGRDRGSGLGSREPGPRARRGRRPLRTATVQYSLPWSNRWDTPIPILQQRSNLAMMGGVRRIPAGSRMTHASALGHFADITLAGG